MDTNFPQNPTLPNYSSEEFKKADLPKLFQWLEDSVDIREMLAEVAFENNMPKGEYPHFIQSTKDIRLIFVLSNKGILYVYDRIRNKRVGVCDKCRIRRFLLEEIEKKIAVVILTHQRKIIRGDWVVDENRFSIVKERELADYPRRLKLDKGKGSRKKLFVTSSKNYLYELDFETLDEIGKVKLGFDAENFRICSLDGFGEKNIVTWDRNREIRVLSQNNEGRFQEKGKINIQQAIHTIKTADITKNGIDEIIVATEDGTLKIFTGDLVRILKIDVGEPLSVFTLSQIAEESPGLFFLCGTKSGKLLVYNHEGRLLSKRHLPGIYLTAVKRMKGSTGATHLILGFSNGVIQARTMLAEIVPNQKIQQVYRRMIDKKGVNSRKKELKLFLDFLKEKPKRITFLLLRWMGIVNDVSNHHHALPNQAHQFFSLILHPCTNARDYYQRLNIRERFFLLCKHLSDESILLLLENFTEPFHEPVLEVFQFLNNLASKAAHKKLKGFTDYKEKYRTSLTCKLFQEKHDAFSLSNLKRLREVGGFDIHSVFQIESAPVFAQALSSGDIVYLDKQDKLRLLPIKHTELSPQKSENELASIEIPEPLSIIPLSSDQGMGDLAVLNLKGKLTTYETSGNKIIPRYSFQLGEEFTFARMCQIGSKIHVIATQTGGMLLHYIVSTPKLIVFYLKRKVKPEKSYFFPYKLSFAFFLLDHHTVLLGNTIGRLFILPLSREVEKNYSLGPDNTIKPFAHISGQAFGCVPLQDPSNRTSFIVHTLQALFLISEDNRDPSRGNMEPLKVSSQLSHISLLSRLYGNNVGRRQILFLLFGTKIISLTGNGQKVLSSRALPFYPRVAAYLPPSASNTVDLIPIVGETREGEGIQRAFYFLHYFPEKTLTAIQNQWEKKSQPRDKKNDFCINLNHVRLPNHHEIAVIPFQFKKLPPVFNEIKRISESRGFTIYRANSGEDHFFTKFSSHDIVFLFIDPNYTHQRNFFKTLPGILKKYNHFRLIISTNLAFSLVREKIKDCPSVSRIFEIPLPPLSKEDLINHLQREMQEKFMVPEGVNEIFRLSRGVPHLLFDLWDQLKDFSIIDAATVQVAAQNIKRDEGVMWEMLGQLEEMDPLFPLILFYMRFMEINNVQRRLSLKDVMSEMHAMKKGAIEEAIKTFKELSIVEERDEGLISLIPVWRVWLDNFHDPLKKLTSLILESVGKGELPLGIIQRVEESLLSRLKVKFRVASDFYQNAWHDAYAMVTLWDKLNEDTPEQVKNVFRDFWKSFCSFLQIQNPEDAHVEDKVLSLDLDLCNLHLPSTLNPRIYVLRDDTPKELLFEMFKENLEESRPIWLLALKDSLKNDKLSQELRSGPYRALVFNKNNLRCFLGSTGRRNLREKIEKECSLALRSGYQAGGGIRPRGKAVFIGRIGTIDKVVQSSTSHIILGPRRIGKTSLLYHIKDILERKKNKVAYVDCSGFIRDEEILKRMGRTLGCKDDIISVPHFEDLLNGMNPAPFIILDEYDSKVQWDLFAIEKPEFGKEQTLSWRLRALAGENRIRLIIAGFYMVSRSLRDSKHPFAHFPGTTIYLGTLNDGEIRDLLTLPMRSLGVSYESGAIELLIQYISGLPYLGQLLPRTLLEKLDERGETKISLLLIEETVKETFILKGFLDTITTSLRRPIERLFYCSHIDKTRIHKKDIKNWLQQYKKDLNDNLFERILSEMLLAGIFFSDNEGDEEGYRFLSSKIRHFAKREGNQISYKKTLTNNGRDLFEIS